MAKQEGKTIDSLLDLFEEKNGKIPRSHHQDYMHFLQTSDLSSKTRNEIFHHLRLLSYVLGEEYIHDPKTGEMVIISFPDQLMLLTKSVCYARDSEGHPLNQGLGSLYAEAHRMAAISRRKKHEDAPYSVWGRILNTVLANPAVQDHFGIPFDIKDILSRDTAQQRDIALVREYLLGKRPIVDDKTHVTRYIKSKKDLRSLSVGTLKIAHLQHSPVNTELYLCCNRCLVREHKARGLETAYRALGWNEIIDRLLEEPQVRLYLGCKATYAEDIAIRAR